MSSQISLRQAVTDYFQDIPEYVCHERSPRLWVHDMLHTILKTTPRTARHEIITGIYQAVLLRDVSVSTTDKIWHDMGKEPTLAVIKREVIPRILDFIHQKLRKVPRVFPTDAELAEHYGKAKILSRLIEEKFSCHLGDISLDMLKASPADDWYALVARAEKIYEPIKRTRGGKPDACSIKFP